MFSSLQPDRIYAGDSINFLTETAGYSAADGWQLKYRLVPVSASASAITLASSAEGSSHRIQASAAVTAGWTVGDYAWSSWVELGAEVYTISTGRLSVIADPRTAAAGTDLRTHAERMLEAIEATLEGRATIAQQELEINGRRMRYWPAAELLTLRDRYQAEVRRQRAAAGGGVTNRLQVRL